MTPAPAPAPLSGSGNGVDSRGSEVVRRYLDRLVAHDWDGVTGCLSTEVVRVGPFGDTYTPRAAYVAFLAGLMPTLEDYRMDVTRVVAEGPVVTAELTETVNLGGQLVVTPEALVFDLDAEGLIDHIGIYIRRLG